ncbi:6-carboxytetrahydropterin synthase QueD [Mangrovibacillus cuniculi]|uniref:6-carboxy-5,6,7,8-tetrahydropterin synthase n=1 Tax=Mangrovibacillus cuniculi TaxID=2593652 RepID=A0A7S8CBV7_9BACI|nr:6-carboxytetrahydropterin synthase QueD [Mangrovibacillus cuniculi]QPC47082.1 6-carboxytetrahydropterin synthase QueD [Mangrovibacillus cuniculi]
MNQWYPSVIHDYSYELNKDFQFAAAHYVPHESAGVCQRVHGHTYYVNVTVAGDDLDHAGFLIDFKQLKNWVHDRFDHQLLNEDPLFNNEDSNRFPTTEVMARTIWEIIETNLQKLDHQPTCVQVIVRETPTSYVIYRPKKEVNK